MTLENGHCIEFRDAATNHAIKKRVVRVETFPTFDAMLRQSGVSAFGLSGSIEEAVAVYHSFGDYKNDEEKYGVAAIHIR